MKICDYHRDQLQKKLEHQGYPPKSWKALHDAEHLILCNAMEQNPAAALREGCPVCQRPLFSESLAWAEEAAKAIAWKDFQEGVENGKIKIS